MTHTYRSHYFHLIWAIKHRTPLIHKEIQARLYQYIDGILKANQCKLIAIGGTDDHIHLLVSLNSLDQFSFLIRAIKAKSSYWVNKNFSQQQHFDWQDGYASFSVSYSGVKQVKYYIDNQENHHRTNTYKDELITLLQKNQIRYEF